ncbi:MAG: acyloxyacyl hydrolase [Proteobacteria bacterium]|nr:acyloxyacyl hydrolase [Pseudomonadota bacterium]MDA1022255.1 acyloxyacyl hydrolase [Pseudomonadota bacterium]
MLKRFYFNFVVIFAATTAAIAVPSVPARADDPAMLSFGVGAFDFNRQKDQGAEFRLDYRSDYKLGPFKPFLTAAGVSNAMSFVGVGVLIDVYFGKRFVVTPSFAPTWWQGKTDDLDLGHALEFRSQLEFAYRFDDRSRLGLAVSHSSNASLGDTNPGTETILVNYSVPIGKLF